MEPNWSDGHDVLRVGNNTGPTDYRADQAAHIAASALSGNDSAGGSSGNVSDQSVGSSRGELTNFKAVEHPLEPSSPDLDEDDTHSLLNAAVEAVQSPAARVFSDSDSDSASASASASGDTGSGSISPKSGPATSSADLAGSLSALESDANGQRNTQHVRAGSHPGSAVSNGNSIDSGSGVGSSLSQPLSVRPGGNSTASNVSTDRTPANSPKPTVALPPPPHTQGTVSVTDNEGRSILIVLLRNDLRIHDNPLFTCAHRDRAPPPPEWMGEQHPDANYLRGGNRLGQALLGPGLPNHTLQGIDGGGVFADEWNLASQSQYILPLFVFDERAIELSGLPGYERQGPEARTPAYGFWKTGGFRVRFIVECIADLRQRLIQRGSDLLIRFGKTEQVLDELVWSLQAQGDSVEGVWMQKEAASEDIELERHIAKTMHSRRVPLSFSYGKTLIHPADLPFDIKDCPDVFTPFRKKVESLGKRMVRATAQPPAQFKPFPSHINDVRNYQLNIDPYSDINGVLNAGRSTGNKTTGPPSYDVATGQVEEPKVDSISWDDLMKLLLHAILQPQCAEVLNNYAALTSRHPASAFPFRGGETSALERLEWYFMRGRMASGPAARGGLPPVARYKQTRNNLLGSGYSTKMSPFLAYGCVSARQIWETLNDLEERLGEDQSTYWVRFELQWRDYFFIQAARFGDLLYALGGFETITDPRQAEKKADWWKPWDPLEDPAKNQITRLLEGRTGIPFIDAQIVELRESGFMSNRGRQNVASFLSKDLQCDWRVGAEFFASHLIDYDATSNFGNW